MLQAIAGEDQLVVRRFGITLLLNQASKRAVSNFADKDYDTDAIKEWERIDAFLDRSFRCVAKGLL